MHKDCELGELRECLGKKITHLCVTFLGWESVFRGNAMILIRLKQGSLSIVRQL